MRARALMQPTLTRIHTHPCSLSTHPARARAHTRIHAHTHDVQRHETNEKAKIGRDFCVLRYRLLRYLRFPRLISFSCILQLFLLPVFLAFSLSLSISPFSHLSLISRVLDARTRHSSLTIRLFIYQSVTLSTQTFFFVHLALALRTHFSRVTRLHNDNRRAMCPK